MCHNLNNDPTDQHSYCSSKLICFSLILFIPPFVFFYIFIWFSSHFPLILRILPLILFILPFDSLLIPLDSLHTPLWFSLHFSLILIMLLFDSYPIRIWFPHSPLWFASPYISFCFLSNFPLIYTYSPLLLFILPFDSYHTPLWFLSYSLLCLSYYPLLRIILPLDFLSYSPMFIIIPIDSYQSSLILIKLHFSVLNHTLFDFPHVLTPISLCPS